MPPPDQHVLHEAALRHLARYAATAAGLTRVLDRRIARWASAPAESMDASEISESVQESRRVARLVVARLVEAGAVDDAGFAVARAARLARAGRSRRMVAAHLATRGVAADVARTAVDGNGHDAPADELASALVHARRRRIGPFRNSSAPPDSDAHRRELAMLARAGFPREIAVRALRMPEQEAQVIVTRFTR